MKTFFKNLNSIRFFAASLVIIHHIEQFKELNGLPNDYHSKVINYFGKLGVCLFFVLSGFLITSLLIAEKRKFQKIAIKDFYIRRILRIWPLYILVVTLALYIFPLIPSLSIPQWINPYENLLANSLLMFLILPNVQQFVYGQIPYAAQCWSIGVEEQFYLFWPLMVHKIKSEKHLQRFIAGLIAVYILVRIFCLAMFHFTHENIFYNINLFMSSRFQFDCLMIGCLFSFLNNSPRKNILTSKPVQIITYLLLLLFTAKAFYFFGFYWEVYAFLFAVVIINLVNDTSLINLEYKPLSYLGKISYGLYMIHSLIINLVIRFITHNSILIYVCTFALTILVASISYRYFERPFLTLKEKYRKIKSEPSLVAVQNKPISS